MESGLSYKVTDKEIDDSLLGEEDMFRSVFPFASNVLKRMPDDSKTEIAMCALALYTTSDEVYLSKFIETLVEAHPHYREDVALQSIFLYQSLDLAEKRLERIARGLATISLQYCLSDTIQQAFPLCENLENLDECFLVFLTIGLIPIEKRQNVAVLLKEFDSLGNIHLNGLLQSFLAKALAPLDPDLINNKIHELIPLFKNFSSEQDLSMKFLSFLDLLPPEWRITALTALQNRYDTFKANPDHFMKTLLSENIIPREQTHQYLTDTLESSKKKPIQAAWLSDCILNFSTSLLLEEDDPLFQKTILIKNFLEQLKADGDKVYEELLTSWNRTPQFRECI